MIITRLKGGLGNQMFQYAFGRTLAYRYKTELKFDLSKFSSDPLKRKFELDNFQIQGTVAAPKEIAAFCDRDRSPLVRKLRKLFKVSSHIKEKSLIFNAAYLDIPDNSYIEGYWQNENYFKDIASIIRSELLPRENADDINLEMLNAIKNTVSISVHVRRGDYVTNHRWEPCSLEYYKQAISRVCQYISDPVFYLFSDEPDWAHDNLEINYPVTSVNWNKEAHYWDLFLMSNCQHHIIANSSFSWWGAWLSSGQEKTVYAPKKWFKGDSVRSSQIIPAEWHPI